MYGVVFCVSAALIFTIAIKPRPLSPLRLPLTYPKTRTVDITDTYFGVKVADPYRWLENAKSPETQAWVDAQNNLARSYLDALPGREGLAAHLRELYHIDTISPPERAGNNLFYVKRKSTDEKAILYWCSVDQYPGA